MENIAILFTIISICVGTLFSLSGVIGYFRFNDVYTRLHATAKVSVFGSVFLMFAAILNTKLSFGKGLVFISLLMISGPVISHSLASAAYRLKIPLSKSNQDDLAEKMG